jgi:hypothetical protein
LLSTLSLSVGHYASRSHDPDLGFEFKTTEFRDEAEDFSLQLIGGIVFVHYYSIAHLDIKPVADHENRLYIIDFVKAESWDELIDEWCDSR